MAHNRSAADKITEDYWVDYFGPYGKMFVREIPRVIKAAVLPKLQRAANAERNARVASTVVPLGFGVMPDGGLHLDGVVRVEQGRRKSAQMFHAEFSADGKLLDIETRKAPVA